MLQPTWRMIVPELKIPRPGESAPWVLVVEAPTAGKLMRVVASGEWTPASAFPVQCTADGFFKTKPAPGPLVTSAPLGALIARLGGSTADQTVDTPASGQQPNRILFSIGRTCIFSVPTAPVGALFLGVNDHPECMADVTGELTVRIFEAI